jgi:hypothetical protein
VDTASDQQVSPQAGLSSGDIEAIAQRVAEIMKPTTRIAASAIEEEALKPVEVKVVEAEILETIAPSPEQVALMTPEQVTAFNQREVAKMRARKKAQAANIKKMENMSVGERMAAVKKKRPAGEIRIAIDPSYDGDDYVRVRCLRKIGLDVGITSDINEEVDMPRHAAQKLQSTGKVAVVI